MFYRLENLRLAQDIFTYRYHLPVESRLAAAACQMCSLVGMDREAPSRNLFPFYAIFIGIFSARKNFLMRQAIRQSWGRIFMDASSEFSHPYKFFVGEGAEALDEEIRNFGDIIVLPVEDKYRNITRKSLLMLQWVSQNCKHSTRFFLRIDDDIYLRAVPLLLQLRRRPPVRYWWGFFDYASIVVRNASEEKDYNDPAKEYGLAERFPLYTRGPLYVLSIDLVHMVATSFPSPGYTAHPDDPALGTYLFGLVQARKTFIQIDDRDENRIALNPFCFHQFSRMHSKIWAIHHLNASQLFCMFNIDVGGAPGKGQKSNETGFAQNYYHLEGSWEDLEALRLAYAEGEATFEQKLLGRQKHRKSPKIDYRRNNFPDLCSCATAFEAPHDGYTYHYPYDRFMP